MSARSAQSLLCPFCGGRVRPVENRASSPPSITGQIGQALLADVAFWFFALVFVAFFLWSFVAGAVLTLLACIALGLWYRLQPKRIAYRCEACSTVVTYQEIISPHEPAA
jgi:hypothetical protein